MFSWISNPCEQLICSNTHLCNRLHLLHYSKLYGILAYDNWLVCWSLVLLTEDDNLRYDVTEDFTSFCLGPVGPLPLMEDFSCCQRPTTLGPVVPLPLMEDVSRCCRPTTLGPVGPLPLMEDFSHYRRPATLGLAGPLPLTEVFVTGGLVWLIRLNKIMERLMWSKNWPRINMSYHLTHHADSNDSLTQNR